MFLDGGTALGTVPLDAAGRATFATTLPNGTRSISAVYAGSTDFRQSTSNSITETIADVLSTQTGLAVSPNPVRTKSPVVLRAIVQGPTGSPHGSVSFTDGSTMLGIASITADQTASLTIDSLAPGIHTLIATYLGSDGFTVSASEPIREQVDAVPSHCGVPVIGTPPADTQLSPDGSATLTVATTGSDQQSFQWFLGSYPDMSHPIGSSATATITNLWTSTDVWVLVTNSCGTAHASAHLTATVPARRRSAGGHG
jgi:hypothetical protein